MQNGQGPKQQGGPGGHQSVFGGPKPNGGKSNSGVHSRGPSPEPPMRSGPPPLPAGSGMPRGQMTQGGSPMGINFPPQHPPKSQGMPQPQLNAWVSGQQKFADGSSDEYDDDYSTGPSSLDSHDEFSRPPPFRRESAPMPQRMYFQNDPRRSPPQYREHRKSFPQYHDDQIEYIIDGSIDRMQRLNLDDPRPRESRSIARRVQRGSVHLNTPIQYSTVPRSVRPVQYGDYNSATYSRPVPVPYEEENSRVYRRESTGRVQTVPLGRYDRGAY